MFPATLLKYAHRYASSWPAARGVAYDNRDHSIAHVSSKTRASRCKSRSLILRTRLWFIVVLSLLTCATILSIVSYFFTEGVIGPDPSILTFTSGQSTGDIQCADVTILDNSFLEGERNFSVRLSLREM